MAARQSEEEKDRRISALQNRVRELEAQNAELGEDARLLINKQDMLKDQLKRFFDKDKEVDNQQAAEVSPPADGRDGGELGGACSSVTVEDVESTLMCFAKGSSVTGLKSLDDLMRSTQNPIPKERAAVPDRGASSSGGNLTDVDDFLKDLPGFADLQFNTNERVASPDVQVETHVPEMIHSSSGGCRFSCSCGAGFEWEPELKAHLQSANSPRLVCVFKGCYVMYDDTPEQRRDHIASHYQHRCARCEKCFHSVQDLKNHSSSESKQGLCNQN